MAAQKRQKASATTPNEHDSDADASSMGEDQPESQKGVENFGTDDDEGSSSAETDDIPDGTRRTKSKKTLKRKRRATEPSQFGVTLLSLLDTTAPSSLPLSLKPSIARQKNDQKMESKAKKALQMEKKDKEDQGRVKDVIGGWGAESERSLRKVAQRGVVQLFNTIQQSQAAAAADGPKTLLGSGKQSHLLSSTKKAAAQNRGKHKDVVAGKEATVAKDDFYDLIRSGGLVSKK